MEDYKIIDIGDIRGESGWETRSDSLTAHYEIPHMWKELFGILVMTIDHVNPHRIRVYTHQEGKFIGMLGHSEELDSTVMGMIEKYIIRKINKDFKWKTIN
jgi:hypothetical protein